MEGDRELALLIRLGIPTKIDYQDFTHTPFWRVKERLALHLLEGELYKEAKSAVLTVAASRQGYPGKSINVDVAKSLAKAASSEMVSLGKHILPWLEVGEIGGEEAEREEMLKDIEERNEAWIARFEPENLEAYREQRRRSAEGADKDA